MTELTRGWVTGSGWQWTMDEFGVICSVAHVCEANEPPIRCVEDGWRFVCPECGAFKSALTVVEEIGND